MTEPYRGDMMLECPLTPADFRLCHAVVVSGHGLNFCGHMLLHAGNRWYVHVAGVNDVPKFMLEDGYRRYLKETGKRELRRWTVELPDPAGAHARLTELLTKQWLWLVLPHNCANFVETIVQAGGSKAGMYLNCPTLEPFGP